MKENSTTILQLLTSPKGHLVTEIIGLSGLGSGTVHTTLTRMESKGLVETWTNKALSNPRYAKITKTGKLYLKGKLMTEKAVNGK